MYLMPVQCFKNFRRKVRNVGHCFDRDWSAYLSAAAKRVLCNRGRPRYKALSSKTLGHARGGRRHVDRFQLVFLWRLLFRHEHLLQRITPAKANPYILDKSNEACFNADEYCSVS